MIQTIRNAWAVPELRKKMLFTVFALLIFRLGSAIPVPYIDSATLEQHLQTQSGTILGLMNAMSGSAFSMATIFALSIQPYINSSIIIQLLTVAIPALERLAKEGGEEGRKKIASITRYATVAIALLQGFGYYSLIKSYGLIESSSLNGVWVALVIVLSFTAGSAFVMWLGEQITEFGIGNGISMILFAGILARIPTAGIVSRFPRMISDCVSGVTIWSAVKNGTMTEETLTAAGYSATQAKAQLSMALAPWMIPVIVIGMLALVVFIVFISNAERRLPVQYAKRVVGRKMWPVHPHPHEGEHVRRHAHHLRPVHRCPACHHRRLCRMDHAEQRADASVRHQQALLQHPVLPADRGLQLFLCHHAVQPRGGLQQPEEERRLYPRLPSR